MIPETLAECHITLDTMLCTEDKEYLKLHPLRMHMTLGMWMRNNWGLWEKGPLWQHFATMGLSHPDDMSAIILESYSCYLNQTEFDLNDKVQYYIDYWKQINAMD